MASVGRLDELGDFLFDVVQKSYQVGFLSFSCKTTENLLVEFSRLLNEFLTYNSENVDAGFYCSQLIHKTFSNVSRRHSAISIFKFASIKPTDDENLDSKWEDSEIWIRNLQSAKCFAVMSINDDDTTTYEMQEFASDVFLHEKIKNSNDKVPKSELVDLLNFQAFDDASIRECSEKNSFIFDRFSAIINSKTNDTYAHKSQFTDDGQKPSERTFMDELATKFNEGPESSFEESSSPRSEVKEDANAKHEGGKPKDLDCQRVFENEPGRNVVIVEGGDKHGGNSELNVCEEKKIESLGAGISRVEIFVQESVEEFPKKVKCGMCDFVDRVFDEKLAPSLRITNKKKMKIFRGKSNANLGYKIRSRVSSKLGKSRSSQRSFGKMTEQERSSSNARKDLIGNLENVQKVGNVEDFMVKPKLADNSQCRLPVCNTHTVGSEYGKGKSV